MEIETVSTVANLSPEAGLRRGERLRFEAKQLYFEGSNGDYMPVGSQQGILMALSFRDDDGHHTTGSAAMVGSGIAICAAHVLEDQGFFKKLTSGGATLVAQAPVPGGVLLWTVTHIATVPKSDLAVLSMTLAFGIGQPAIELHAAGEKSLNESQPCCQAPPLKSSASSIKNECRVRRRKYATESAAWPPPTMITSWVIRRSEF